MASQAIENPLPTFTGLNGQPLSNGYVYFGQPNQDPREYPISVYYDDDLTLPVIQPLRTNAGYLYRNGSPTNVWVNGTYSVLVLDSAGRQVYYSPEWTAASSENIAFVQQGSGAILRSAQSKMRERYSVLDFGADPTGVTDSTAQFALTVAAAWANNKVLVVPKGTYLLSELVFSGKELMTVIMEGCTLKVLNHAASSSGLIRISTSPGLSIQGTFYLDMQFSLSYETAILCDSGYVHIWDPRMYNCNLAFTFGDENGGHAPEYGVSEIFVHGGYTWACNQLVKAWGANTAATFVGSGLLTGSVADQQGSSVAYQNADTTSIIAIGARVLVVGGYLTNVRTAYPTINLQPIDSSGAGYYKDYGSVICSGTLIESNGLLETTNPDALVSTGVNVGLSLSNCSGYWGANVPYIVLDSNFKQSIKIDGTCSFYTASTHTEKLVDSNSTSANIYIDQAAFKQFWQQGLLNIDGGIPHFTAKTILTRNTSVTNVGASATTVDFTIDGAGPSAVYGSGYYSAGTFTVPPGGLEDIHIEAQIYFNAAVTSAADLSILIDGGTTIAFGWIKNKQLMGVSATVPTLNAGQTIRIQAATNVGAQVLGGGALNSFSITASRP